MTAQSYAMRGAFGDSGSAWSQEVSSGRAGCRQKRVEGDVFKEANFDADGDDLSELRGACEVFTASAELREREVSGAGEFQTRGDDGGVEFECSANLDFNAELHGGGGERATVKDPAATVCEGSGKYRQDPGALLVAKALDIERLHVGLPPVVWIFDSGLSMKIGLLAVSSGCSSVRDGDVVMGGEARESRDGRFEGD